VEGKAMKITIIGVALIIAAIILAIWLVKRLEQGTK
jgi:hypothetical protein